MRLNRKKYSQLSPDDKMKSCCRSQANAAQRRGKLLPENCQMCGADRAQKHHPDFTRPLDVVWLCRACSLIVRKRGQNKQQKVNAA